jgi:subtilisin family serine protease
LSPTALLNRQWPGQLARKFKVVPVADRKYRDSKNAYNTWLHDLIKVYDTFPCEPSADPSDATEKNRRPVRIAVIDTGYDSKHILLASARIMKTCCSDCLDHPDSCMKDHMRDNDGHGTHVLGLLLDCNVDTQIFIVKLDEANEDDLATTKASQKKVAKVSSSYKCIVTNLELILDH